MPMKTARHPIGFQSLQRKIYPMVKVKRYVWNGVRMFRCEESANTPKNQKAKKGERFRAEKLFLTCEALE
jgi:hypothetical protein